jgi:hypothetical protein
MDGIDVYVVKNEGSVAQLECEDAFKCLSDKVSIAALVVLPRFYRDDRAWFVTVACAGKAVCVPHWPSVLGGLQGVLPCLLPS